MSTVLSHHQRMGPLLADDLVIHERGEERRYIPRDTFEVLEGLAQEYLRELELTRPIVEAARELCVETTIASVEHLRSTLIDYDKEGRDE